MENPPFTRGPFSSRKEIMQTSSWRSGNESGKKALQVQNALRTLERVCFLYKFVYDVASLVAQLVKTCSAEYLSSMTGSGRSPREGIGYSSIPGLPWWLRG